MSLIQAAKDGDLAQVQALVSQGTTASDPEAVVEAICRAALHGHLAIVELLVRTGVDVNPPSGNNNAPLICALEEMHVEIMEYLLQNGADINIRDENGHTPLHHAVGVESEEAFNVHERPATAAPLTALLIRYGADVNAKNVQGYTPLDFARSGNNAPAVQLLLAHGAISGKDPGA